MQLCVLERLRPQRSTEARVRRQRIAAQKLVGGHAFLAFELNFKELEPGIFGARGQKTMALNNNPARLGKTETFGKTAPRDGHVMHDEFLPVESSEGARPRLESTPAIVDFVRGARGKVDAAVFAVEQRRKSCNLVDLRLPMNRAAGQAS